uniref:Probable cytochrome P450 CYP44-like n=1 Tax=Saccoglossus kowalevskii TaxID=10224 RepID=A0ABM0LWW9_SACKO|nr:PREDICTED: probable cytochrome P450 CYP44-like [Saccoglossus kowalevskii]
MAHLRGYNRVIGIVRTTNWTNRKVTTITSTRAGDHVVKTTHYANARPFKEIPGPRPLPVIGTAYEYLPFGPYTFETMYEHAMFDKQKKYGNIWKEPMLGRPAVFVVRPKDIETMFRNDGNMPKRTPLDAITRVRKMAGLSLGLGNMQGKEWRRVRSSVQRYVLRPKEISKFHQDLDVVAEDFIQLMKELLVENGEVPDFQNEVYKWALESVCFIALETRLGSLSPHMDANTRMIIDNTHAFFETMGKLTYSAGLHKIISTPTWRTFVKSHEILYRMIKKPIDAIIHLINEGKIDKGEKKFLVTLLSMEDISYEDVMISAYELITGGIETTTHALIFNLYNLATNPEKQKKLHEELVGDTNQEMRYLKACIKETFRLFPLTLGNTRDTSKDMVLCGYQIPAGLVRNFKIEWHHGEMGMTFCVLHKPNMPARFNFIERSPSERPMDP